MTLSIHNLAVAFQNEATIQLNLYAVDNLRGFDLCKCATDFGEFVVVNRR